MKGKHLLLLLFAFVATHLVSAACAQDAKSQLRRLVFEQGQDVFHAASSLNLPIDEALDAVGLEFSDLRLLDFRFVSCLNPIVELAGSAEQLSLSQEDVLSYLKLRLRNDVSGLPFCRSEDLRSRSNEPAFVVFTLWTVGNDYPVAFHMKIEILKTNPQRTEFKPLFSDAVLGYHSASRIESAYRETLDDFVRKLGISILKGRGEY
jgi:hypothetical protein